MQRLTALAVLLAASTAYGHGDHSAPLMKDFMGINTHTIQFNAERYPVCRLVRDFHPAGWDYNGDAANPLDLPRGTHAISWKDQTGMFRDHDGIVDWSKVYSEWVDEGFEITVSIMFDAEHFATDPEANAYRYGKAFAEALGSSSSSPYVTSAEIGNEPAGADFDEELFQKIFVAMAKGIRAGDPKMLIATPTADAIDADDWSMPMKLFTPTPDLFDVINLHKYAMTEGFPTWARTYPESTKFDYLEHLRKNVEWRDEHMPDKQIWITEFGYDASTQPPPAEGNFSKFEDTPDPQQAQWIVRAFLNFADIGLDRAYLYWWDDNDTPTLHAASGITRFGKPKPSFWAMKHLYETLGDYRYSRAIEKKAESLYVFEFAHGERPDQLIWVVWSPTGSGVEQDLLLPLPGKVAKAERMPMEENEDTAVELEQADDNSVTVTVTESPLYIWFE